ncbi:MAG: tetratricopeptide repeat protein [Pseudarcicella sp.]|nr:tetratricopeptide repeat protein [Pseudarcicella sp.]MBP6410065.1 tetratricopeptide repeat protein [Pseudarcicella sp.]
MKKLFFRLFIFTIILFPSEFYGQNTLIYSQNESNFRAGQEHFVLKNYSAALNDFNNFINSPRHLLDNEDATIIQAEYYIALSSLYLGNLDTDLLADRFINKHPEHPSSKHLFKEFGDFYFKKGDYSSAKRYLQKSIGRDPQARLELALADYHLENYTEALENFDLLKNEDLGNISLSAAYYSGVINFKNGNFKQAVEDFKIAEKSSEYGPEIPNWIANSYYKQGRLTEMLSYTEPILNNKSNPFKIDQLALLTADVYFQQNNFEKASKYFQKYASDKSNVLTPGIKYKLGFSLYKTEQYQAASEYLKNVAAQQDTIGQNGAYILGICYLKNNNPNYALAAFDQASKLKFNKSIQEDASFNYAKVLLDLGRENDCIKSAKQFLVTYPNSDYYDDANELISEAYLSSNNYQAALTYIEGLKKRTTRVNKAYQRIAYNQAVAEFNSENYAKAHLFFDKSLVASEDLSLKYAAQFWKAEAFSSEKKYGDAIPLYNSLIWNQDKSANNLSDLQIKSRYALGYAYYNTKEYEKSNQQFKAYYDKMKTLPDNDQYNDGMVRLADTYYAAKNYNEALAYYDKALLTSKTDRDYASYQKATILVIKNDFAGAKKIFQNIQLVYPNSSFADDAMLQEANLEFNAQQYGQAIASYSKLIKTKSKSPILPIAYNKRAAAYSNTKNHEAAYQDFKFLLQNYPNSKYAKDALVGIQEELNELGKPEEFSQILNDYQLANPEDASTTAMEYQAAKNLYQNESYTKAITALENYIQKYPKSVERYEANYLIADSYFRIENKSQALKYYTIVVAENKFKSVAKAATRAAEISFKSADFPTAITFNKALLGISADKKDQQNALLNILDCYYNLGNQDSTLYFSKEIINLGEFVLGARSKASLYAGKICFDKNETVKAVDFFNQTITFSKDNNGAEAQYLLAKILYNQKKYKESHDMILNKLNNESIFPNVSENISGRAFILLADNFVGMENIFQAKATLKSIVDNSTDTAVVNEAAIKLKVLENK